MRSFIRLLGTAMLAFNTISSAFASSQPSTGNKLNTLSFAQSTDTAIVFASNRDGQFEIYRVDPDGADLVRLTNSSGNDTEPVWSPDKQRIAFTSTRDGNKEIYVMNPDGGQQRNISKDLANDESPTWAADGKMIAFVSDRVGNREIYVIEVDGTNPINVSNTSNAEEEFPAWSPDGLHVAFASAYDDRHHEINVVQANGTNLRTISRAGTKPNWSPDGRQIVFEGDEEDRLNTQGGTFVGSDIYIIDADGNNLLNLANHSLVDSYQYPKWSPNGQYIAFLGLVYGENEYGLYSIEPNGSEITLLHKETDPFSIHDNWAWSPDSNYIAFSMGSPVHSPYGEIYLLDVKSHEILKLISDPFLNIQPSWQTILNKQPASTSTSEQPFEQTTQPTPQQESQQATLEVSPYFYIYGLLFTTIGAITTILLFLWLARRRAYSTRFLGIGISGIITFLVLVFAGVLLRNNTNLNPNRIPTVLTTSASTVTPSPTPLSIEKSTTSEGTQWPTPAKTKNQAEISCQNKIYFVSLRGTPGYVGKTDPADKIYEIPCGQIVELLGPSEVVDSLTWWKVSWNGYTGWIADHTQSGKVVLIFNP